MTDSARAYSLNELCELSGVTRRTVRYYIQEGLLPSASRTGPNVDYSERFLLRLRLIVRLKEQDLSLARIREKLRELQDYEIRKLLDEPGPDESGSAADYIRDVLAQAEHIEHRRDVAGRGPRPPAEFLTSNWKHLEITSDVQLHIRGPLTSRAKIEVERLLEAARTIFHKEPRR